MISGKRIASLLWHAAAARPAATPSISFGIIARHAPAINGEKQFRANDAEFFHCARRIGKIFLCLLTNGSGGCILYPADDIWVWRSLVACLNGVQEAGGSNPLTQTTRKPLKSLRFQGFCFLFSACHLAESATFVQLCFQGFIPEMICSGVWIFCASFLRSYTHCMSAGSS